jgi:hypothetical protein
VHAARESAAGAPAPGPDERAVALAVEGAPALEALALRLAAAGVPHALVRDERGEAMAIGVAPAPRALASRHLSSIPLLKEAGERKP